MQVEGRIEVPANSNAKQKGALKEFDKADGRNTFPKFGKFKKRLDKFLKRAAE